MIRSIACLALAFVTAFGWSAVGPARGPLIVVGGGGTPADVVQRAVELSGGAAAVVAVLPHASERADRGEASAQMFRDAGAQEVFVLADLASEQARARLERATELNPLQPDLWMRRAEDAAGNGSDREVDSYAEARGLAEHAVRLNRADSDMHLRLARIEARACRTLFPDNLSRSRAADRFRQAESRARFAALIPLEEGEFLFGTDDPAGALAAARRVLELEPNAIPPRLLAARSLVVLGGAGRFAEASRLLAEARRIDDRWRDLPREDAYTREMLHLDEAQAAWIEQRVEGAGR